MQPIPTDKHELVVFLYRRLENRVAGTNGLVTGTLPPDIDFGEVQARLLALELEEFSDASNRRLSFYRTGAFVFDSLDDLLESADRRINLPAKFYLADLNFKWPNSSGVNPPKVERYVQACRLYKLMASVADYKDNSGETLFFLKSQSEKLKLLANYTTAELETLPGLKEFEIEFIEAKTHKQQKQTIIRSVLLEIFPSKEIASLGELFSLFPDFLNRLHINYAMYVAEFSFEKVKIEVDKDNLDSTIKLNKVFSDVQGQLLAIPVGLILIGGQMKDTGKPTLENFLIWGAGLIFVIFMDLLIRNQRHSLEAVHKEISNRRRQLQEKSAAISEKFSEDYNALDRRHRNQRNLIFVIDAVVALSFAGASYLMLKNSGCIEAYASCIPSV